MDGVKDLNSDLVVRTTDNGIKGDDPPQLAPNLDEPLELDADGIPLLLKEQS